MTNGTNRYTRVRIIRLTDAESPLFGAVCGWYEGWLGRANGESTEEIRDTMAHSLCTDRLPQTFIALLDGEPAGMYQLAIADDLTARPDLYPWLINVYVDTRFRISACGTLRSLRP